MALKKKKKKISAAGGSASGGKKTKKVSKKKPAAKKRPAAKKKVVAKKKPVVKEAGTLVGAVTHYFPHVQAAVIKLSKPLTIGDSVKLKGHTTDFTQTVVSMQIDRVDITSAKKGDEIGLQVSSRVRQADKVYKI